MGGKGEQHLKKGAYGVRTAMVNSTNERTIVERYLAWASFGWETQKGREA